MIVEKLVSVFSKPYLRPGQKLSVSCTLKLKNRMYPVFIGIGEYIRMYPVFTGKAKEQDTG